MKQEYLKKLQESDPEFSQFFSRFAEEEVVNEPGKGLDDSTRYMAILSALLGCQGRELFQKILPNAMKAGVTPVQVKEIVYQGGGLSWDWPHLSLLERSQ